MRDNCRVGGSTTQWKQRIAWRWAVSGCCDWIEISHLSTALIVGDSEWDFSLFQFHPQNGMSVDMFHLRRRRRNHYVRNWPRMTCAASLLITQIRIQFKTMMLLPIFISLLYCSSNVPHFDNWWLIYSVKLNHIILASIISKTPMQQVMNWCWRKSRARGECVSQQVSGCLSDLRCRELRDCWWDLKLWIFLEEEESLFKGRTGGKNVLVMDLMRKFVDSSEGRPMMKREEENF